MEEKRERGEQPKPSVKAWFEERANSGTMTVERAILADVPRWGPYIARGGRIYAFGSVDDEGKPTDKYFLIDGFLITNAGREVQKWGQIGITEVKDPSDPDRAVGTVGLLVDRETGEILLQAVAEPLAAEPGKPAEAYVNLRASIQGSYTNLVEHKVPNAEHVKIGDYTYFSSLNPSRIQGKVRYGISTVDKKDITIGPNSAWFSSSQVDQAILEGVPMNGALHTALNIYKAQKFEGSLASK